MLAAGYAAAAAAFGLALAVLLSPRPRRDYHPVLSDIDALVWREPVPLRDAVPVLQTGAHLVTPFFAPDAIAPNLPPEACSHAPEDPRCAYINVSRPNTPEVLRSRWGAKEARVTVTELES